MLTKEAQEKIFQDELQAEINRIKSAPPDSAIAKANQHLLGDGVGSTWAGGGLLHLLGIAWYTVECPLALSDFSSGAKAVLFHGAGLDWAAGAFAAPVLGAFVVDPKTLGGKCLYRVVFAAAEIGIATLFLYGPNGEFYGNFSGPIVEGAGAGFPQGSGDLLVS